MKLHFRAPSGSRIEYTDELVAQVEDHIRAIVPAAELGTINSMIGVPGPTNMAYTPTDNASAMDAEILISLKPGHHPTDGYVRKIRTDVAASFPGSSAYFQTADIVSQVLNFGLSAPIDIQVQYNNLREAFRVAALLRDRVSTIPGAADVHVKQVLDYPTMRVDVDRQRASEMGLSQSDVANAMLVSLSSSALVSPSFYIDPANGVNYLVAVKVPLSQFQNVRSVMSTPVTSPKGQLNQRDPATLSDVPHAPTQTLGNVASIHDDVVPNEIDHYIGCSARVVDVNANVEGSDLGSVISGVNKAIAGIGDAAAGNADLRARAGRGDEPDVRSGSHCSGWWSRSCSCTCFDGGDVSVMARPVHHHGGGAGRARGRALDACGDRHDDQRRLAHGHDHGRRHRRIERDLARESFANDLRLEQHYLSPDAAAVEAGRVRLRPVLMTALAMILGMLPMAIGAGEGGEQNAPLGRAVIGGLMVATIVTLLVIPVVYAKLRRALPTETSAGAALPRRVAGPQPTIKRESDMPGTTDQNRSANRSPLSGALRLTAVVVVVVAIGAAIVLASRRSRAATDETARRTGDAVGGPTVRAVTAIASAPSHQLELLAEARPFASVTLYAKVSGYLKSIAVDKGDRVKADQVVAIIESPETDASWSAATADYKQKQLTASRPQAAPRPEVCVAGRNRPCRSRRSRRARAPRVAHATARGRKTESAVQPHRDRAVGPPGRARAERGGLADFRAAGRHGGGHGQPAHICIPRSSRRGERSHRPAGDAHDG